MSARSMTMVLALGMSRPDSMIVVHTRTSAAPSANVSITFSSAPSPICPWPDDDPRRGQQPPQLLGLRLDRLDPVVDVEHLPAAVELAQDRVADEAGRRLGDPGLDRQAVLGRGLDDAQVPDPGQREVQRARDRRRGQREHVDRAPELLEPLLGRDAEPLLLVDHDQAEVPERDVLRQQPVGADDDVDRPVGEPLDRRLLLLRANEPRQQPHGQRERREALARTSGSAGRRARSSARAPRPACRPASP